MFVPRKSAHCADRKADEKIHNRTVKHQGYVDVDESTYTSQGDAAIRAETAPLRQTPTGETSKNNLRQVAIKRNSRHKNSCLLPRVRHSWCAMILHTDTPYGHDHVNATEDIAETEPIHQMPMGETSKNIEEKKEPTGVPLGIDRAESKRVEQEHLLGKVAGRKTTCEPEEKSHRHLKGWKHCRKGWDLEDEWMGTALMAREQRREAVLDGQTSQ
ncbi:hypothetical protein BDZ89DRAFT_1051538 [Hymenopellis radicata]|nr:hypothetical protein BDZ89DRAFT_1051538 [Hymenopellis radicata]